MFIIPKTKVKQKTSPKPELPKAQSLQSRDIYRIILESKNRGAKNASR